MQNDGTHHHENEEMNNPLFRVELRVCTIDRAWGHALNAEKKRKFSLFKEVLPIQWASSILRIECDRSLLEIILNYPEIKDYIIRPMHKEAELGLHQEP